MTAIKVLLLLAILSFAILAFRGSRRAIHKVVWRGYVILVVIAAGLSVIFPDAVTWLANEVGVGRGTDLVLYTFVVTFMLVVVVLFRRVGELERQYTQIARKLAIGEVTARTRQDDDP